MLQHLSIKLIFLPAAAILLLMHVENSSFLLGHVAALIYLVACCSNVLFI
jgi:hypothetical protein